MGHNKKFIHFLAHDAELLAKFRLYHRGHAKTATDFSTTIMKHFPECGNFVDGPLDDLSNGVEGELDRLDQTVRDMLQLVSRHLSAANTHLITHGRNSLGCLSTRPIDLRAWAPA